jgi:hypothetical protein
MSSPIVVQLRPARLHIGGRRVHHFWLGFAIVLSDLGDWRVWVSDLRRH